MPAKRANSSEERTIAAIDLGSNSFHMLVARQREGDLRVIDRLREPVRLAAGFDSRGHLNEVIRVRALECLERFGQRVRDLPRGSVRAVGTNALRKARDSRSFLRDARRALGHEIDIISGIEEARLIYSGVARSLASDGDQRRLVLDIGGGSTEIIIGQGVEPDLLESLHMGCVSITEAFFGKAVVTRKAMKKAQLFVRQQMEPVESVFRHHGWDEAVGASGTVRTLAGLCSVDGGLDEGVTPEALGALEKRLLQLRDFDRFTELGVSLDRAEVLAGGLCVFKGVLAALKIDRLRVAEGALREGLLLDLVGRLEQRDVRERTVAAMVDRYRVDPAHGGRVAATAVKLAAAFGETWVGDDEGPRMLTWAARLCDIGLSIAHSSFHKHGAYILRHADLAGFSRQEQQVLATLVRVHRRKFAHVEIEALPGDWPRRTRRLAIILRLAVLLNRSRDPESPPIPAVRARRQKLILTFPPNWLEEHPLTVADLEEEARYLESAGLHLDCA